MKIRVSLDRRSKNIPDIEELLAKVRALTNEGVDPEKSKSITELIKIRLQLSVLKILGIDIPEGNIEAELADDVVDDEKAEQIDELLTVYMVDNYSSFLHICTKLFVCTHRFIRKPRIPICKPIGARDM